MAYLFEGEPIFSVPIAEMRFGVKDILDLAETIEVLHRKIGTYSYPGMDQMVCFGYFRRNSDRICARTRDDRFFYNHVNYNDHGKFSHLNEVRNAELDFIVVVNFHDLLFNTTKTHDDVINAIGICYGQEEHRERYYFHIPRDLRAYHAKFEEHGWKIVNRATLRKYLKQNGARWVRENNRWYTEDQNGVVADIFKPYIPIANRFQ